MRVKIGPYLHYWGPYQIAEALLCVGRNRITTKDTETWRERAAYRFGDWLANTKFRDLCEWIHNKRQRRVYVHVDNYDVWNMNDTLGLIIGPMLLKLKQTKHGSGFVDDADVPESLRSTSAPPRENDWDTDANLHKRYDWMLDELIWVFTADHDSIEDSHYDWGAVNRDASLQDQVQQLKVDTVAQDAYLERKQNAFRLFGKYYQTLWD